MIFSNSDPAQIVCRKQLLCRLIELMERVLSERDRSIILVRCGIEDTGPMDYDGLSAYFGLSSAEEAAFHLTAPNTDPHQSEALPNRSSNRKDGSHSKW